MTCACAACITSTAYAQESTTTPSVGSEVSETSKIDQTSTVAYPRLTRISLLTEH